MPAVDYVLGGQGSIAFWAKLATSGGNYILAGKGQGSGTPSNWLEFIFASNGQFGVSSQGSPSLTSAGTQTPLAWHHFVITTDYTYGINTYTLYIDNVVPAVAGGAAFTPAATTLPTADPLIFGNDNRGNTTVAMPAGSAIQFIGVWSRALSASEVGLLYNGGTAANIA
jgi:hypothetical protein